MGLKLYNKKRDFTKTREPAGKEKSTKKRRFVVQEHHATRLHFDFRLEYKGVMKSWAVPKGPSLNPADKRLAMMVEDHPIDYMYFQGAIPLGEYGGGEVRTWDIGTYEPTGEIEFGEQLRQGKLTFILHGKKLKGEFHMVHMHGREENAWLMFKHKDEYADASWKIERILDYGSRVEAPGAIAKKAKQATALQKLLRKPKAAIRAVKKKRSLANVATADPPKSKRASAAKSKSAVKSKSAAKVKAPKKRVTATSRRASSTRVTAKAKPAKRTATSRKKATAKKVTAKKTPVKKTTARKRASAK